MDSAATDDGPATSSGSGIARGSDTAELRAIFVGNFEYDAAQRDVHNLFSKFGSVARLDMKRGFAFVFMEKTPDGQRAIDALHGMTTPFGSRPRTLKVEWARGDGAVKRREDARRRRASIPSCTLFVVNFDPSQTRRADLNRLFEKYGKILRLDIQDRYAFVQYESIEQATSALKALNDYELGNRNLIVEYTVRSDRERERDRDRRDRGPRHRMPPRREYDRFPRDYDRPPRDFDRPPRDGSSDVAFYERGNDPDNGHGRGRDRDRRPYGRRSPDRDWRGPQRREPYRPSEDAGSRKRPLSPQQNSRDDGTRERDNKRRRSRSRSPMRNGSPSGHRVGSPNRRRASPLANRRKSLDDPKDQKEQDEAPSYHKEERRLERRMSPDEYEEMRDDADSRKFADDERQMSPRRSPPRMSNSPRDRATSLSPRRRSRSPSGSGRGSYRNSPRNSASNSPGGSPRRFQRDSPIRDRSRSPRQDNSPSPSPQRHATPPSSGDRGISESPQKHASGSSPSPIRHGEAEAEAAVA